MLRVRASVSLLFDVVTDVCRRRCAVVNVVVVVIVIVVGIVALFIVAIICLCIDTIVFGFCPFLLKMWCAGKRHSSLSMPRLIVHNSRYHCCTLTTSKKDRFDFRDTGYRVQVCSRLKGRCLSETRLFIDVNYR